MRMSGGVILETYAIVIEGHRAGTLSVERKGLLTVFDGTAQDTGELVRLSVYGGGREGYLGVMTPDGGALHLRRALSKAALRDFPAEIEYAGASGGAAAPEVEKRQPVMSAEKKDEEDAAVFDSDGTDDLLWFSAPDGTLSAYDGRRLLVALPAENARVPRGAESALRYIAGREYIVFPR